jgi:hypothetical protein
MSLPLPPKSYRKQISSHPATALNDFKSLMHQGKQTHNQQNYQSACSHFTQALSLVKQLIDLRPLKGHQYYLTLRIAATHNLCLSLSALGQLANAENILKDLHQSLLKICLAPAVPKPLRITALGALDNSLFSLTSNLGSQGKVDQLYRVISETDRVAELTATQILH